MNEKYSNHYDNLGLNIAYYRKRERMTQQALAELIGIEDKTLSRIENGNVGTSLDVLFALAEVFKIEPYQFLVYRG